MTVIYQQDGRIRVDDPHDALLLSLAGVGLIDENDSRHVFAKNQWFSEDHGPLHGYLLDMPLYVPAEVAKELVTAKACWWDSSIEGLTVKEDQMVQLRIHNNRWNVLPDIIKMESESV
jgi:hypothetical protein